MTGTINWCDCYDCSFNDDGECTAGSIEITHTGNCSECNYEAVK